MTLIHVPPRDVPQSSDLATSDYVVVLRLRGTNGESENQQLAQLPLGSVTKSNLVQNSTSGWAAGTKRMRQETTDFDDGLHSCSDTEADSNFDTDDEYSLYDEDMSGEPSIKIGAELQAAVLDLLTFVTPHIASWIPSVQYAAPPANKLPPGRKHLKGSKRSRPINCSGGLHMDLEHGTVFRVDGYFHLACPFYRADSKKYQSCLWNHQYQSIEDVRGHIRLHHRKPPYCPICYEAFNDAKLRDDHTRSRTCQPRSPRTVDGISEADMKRIKKMDKLYLPEWKRWMRVWDVLFPCTQRPRSPFLQYGVEQNFCMIRDFWAARGTALVEEYLVDHPDLTENQLDGKDLILALSNMALDAILSNTWREQKGGLGPSRDGNGDGKSV